MFNLFKSYTFTWYEVGVFKLALLSIGVLIGARAAAFVLQFETMIAVVAVLATGYSLYVALRQ